MDRSVLESSPRQLLRDLVRIAQLLLVPVRASHIPRNAFDPDRTARRFFELFTRPVFRMYVLTGNTASSLQWCPCCREGKHTEFGDFYGSVSRVGRKVCKACSRKVLELAQELQRARNSGRQEKRTYASWGERRLVTCMDVNLVHRARPPTGDPRRPVASGAADKPHSPVTGSKRKRPESDATAAPARAPTPSASGAHATAPAAATETGNTAGVGVAVPPPPLPEALKQRLHELLAEHPADASAALPNPTAPPSVFRVPHIALSVALIPAAGTASRDGVDVAGRVLAGEHQLAVTMRHAVAGAYGVIVTLTEQHHDGAASFPPRFQALAKASASRSRENLWEQPFGPYLGVFNAITAAPGEATDLFGPVFVAPSARYEFDVFVVPHAHAGHVHAGNMHLFPHLHHSVVSSPQPPPCLVVASAAQPESSSSLPQAAEPPTHGANKQGQSPSAPALRITPASAALLR